MFAIARIYVGGKLFPEMDHLKCVEIKGKYEEVIDEQSFNLGWAFVVYMTLLCHLGKVMFYFRAFEDFG